MDPTRWSVYAAIAQVFATVFTGVTTIVALRTLLELRRDRSLRARPHLLFDRGGFLLDVEELPNIGIPGVNHSYALDVISRAGMQVTSTWHAKQSWGRLTNHGVGAAIGTEITIITKSVTRAGETFEIDAEKLQSCPYEPALNTIPASPSHIEPGKTASFRRLPTVIVLDSKCAVSSASCVVIISYEDIFGQRFETKQSLLVSDERSSSGRILISIGEEVDD